MENQAKRTNVLTKKMVYDLIEIIPELPCYKTRKIARKPLEPERLQLLIETTYEAALRIDEGINLKPHDVFIERSELEIVHSKTGFRWCKCAERKKILATNRWKLIRADPECPKCNGRGKIPVPQFAPTTRTTAQKLIDFAAKNDVRGYFFRSPSFPNQPISYRWVLNQLITAGQMCGFRIFARYKVRRVEQMYSHIFRKSKAKQMEKDGFLLSEIMTQLRHTDEETTAIYLRSGTDDMSEKINDLYG